MTGIVCFEASRPSPKSRAPRWGRVAICGGVVASASDRCCRVYQPWRSFIGLSPSVMTLKIEAERLARALNENRYVEFRGEHHWLSEPDFDAAIILLSRGTSHPIFTSCYTIAEVADGETRLFYPGSEVFWAPCGSSLLMPQSFDTILGRLIQGGIVDIATEWREP